MLVGIVRKEPYNENHRATDKRHKIYLLMMLCHFNGIECFHFYENDVNIKTKTINGVFFDTKTAELVQRKTRYPDVIDTDCNMLWESAEVYNSLFAESAFLYTRRIPKDRVTSIIKKSKYAKYAINSFQYKRSELDNFLLKYNTLIIKPTEGSKGRDVFKVQLNMPKLTIGMKQYLEMKTAFGKKYIVHFKHEKKKLSDKVFNKKYAPALEKESMIMQEYVHSVTNAGNPFDIRVDVRRGKKGRWIFVRSYVKVGSGSGIVSNVAMGGLVTLDTQTFLRTEFGPEEGNRIYNGILQIAHTIPKTLQSATKRFIPTITVDIGVNRYRNNELKIFEVNTGASTSGVFSVMKDSKLRIECYKYMNERKETFLSRQAKLIINPNDSFVFKRTQETRQEEDIESREEIQIEDDEFVEIQ